MNARRPCHRPATLCLALCAALLLAAGPAAAQSDAPEATKAALGTVTELAQLNGQALACQDRAAAGRAKALMLAHAPRTPRFGDAYEDATQRSYLETLRAGAAQCPSPAQLGQRLDALAARLQAQLPAAAK